MSDFCWSPYSLAFLISLSVARPLPFASVLLGEGDSALTAFPGLPCTARFGLGERAPLAGLDGGRDDVDATGAGAAPVLKRNPLALPIDGGCTFGGSAVEGALAERARGCSRRSSWAAETGDGVGAIVVESNLHSQSLWRPTNAARDRNAHERVARPYAKFSPFAGFGCAVLWFGLLS